ncbi:tyrosine-type recombinase/integrase [Enterococcus larvae]|uniref:tyrosine-type recombinase/integrase n=1 Tax=Enterococcus larvae TaxID=2794352 RepID=UPI003F2A8ED2
MGNKNPFIDLAASFINLKQVEGYKYQEETDTLRRFNQFLSAKNIVEPSLPKEIMDEWCQQGLYESRKSMSNRISAIRQFCIYLASLGYEVYIPEAVKKAQNENFVPYIFSHDEIRRIFITIDNLPPGRRYNSDIVYPVLYRVLYGCGLRVGEALSLKIKDVDLIKGIITIHHSKYDKKRIVLMSQSLLVICREYSEKHLDGLPENNYFFRNKDGGKRHRGTIGQQFRNILWQSGIPYLGKGKGPRLHDLRHAFCCHSLKQMSDNGVDLYCALPVLSTYVGHASIAATERYLRLTQDIHTDIEAKMSELTDHVYPEVEYDDETD